MKKVILTIAVAFVFVFVGSVLASPPVPPPEEGFKISTNTNILCTGTVTEDQSFTWNWAFNNADPLIADIQNALEADESVAQTRYEQEFKSYGGVGTVFIKDFDAKSHPDNTPNLEVDKTIGYVSNTLPGSIAEHDERAAIEVISAGTGNGNQFAGMMALCPWATVGDGFPATNESIAMGSSFYVPAVQGIYVGNISAHTSTNAEVTGNVALGYEINASGDGTVNAGMLLSLWEGSDIAVAGGAPGDNPLASRTSYEEFAEAIGDFVFNKSMVYQSVFTAPSPIPENIDQVLNP